MAETPPQAPALRCPLHHDDGHQAMTPTTPIQKFQSPRKRRDRRATSETADVVSYQASPAVSCSPYQKSPSPYQTRRSRTDHRRVTSDTCLLSSSTSGSTEEDDSVDSGSDVKQPQHKTEEAKELIENIRLFNEDPACEKENKSSAQNALLNAAAPKLQDEALSIKAQSREGQRKERAESSFLPSDFSYDESILQKEKLKEEHHRERVEEQYLRYCTDVARGLELGRGDLTGSINYLLQVLQSRILQEPLRKAYLFYWLGKLYWKAGNYRSSLHYLKRARSTYESEGDGLQSEVLIEIYCAMGQVAISTSHWHHAQKYYTQALRAIDFDGLVEGTRSRTRQMQLLQAKVMRQLGFLLLKLGIQEHSVLSKAEAAIHQALQLQQQLLGIWHVDFGSTLLVLGQLYEQRGDFVNAAGTYLDALDIFRNAKSLSGSCHTDMGVALSRIGWLYYISRQFSEALEVYKEASDSLISRLGPSHPNLASLYVQIGLVLKEQRKYSRALKHFKKAIKIQRSVFGDTHECTAQTLLHIASVYKHDSSRIFKAIDCISHALYIRTSVIGEWHISNVQVWVELGRTQQIAGLHKESLGSVKTALDICYKNSLPSHHDLVREARSVFKSE